MQVSPPAEICEGKTIELKASGADLYTWINTTEGLSDTRSATHKGNSKQTTEYTVVGADMYNCFTDTASVIITVNPLPTVEAGADIELKPGGSVQLSPVCKQQCSKLEMDTGRLFKLYSIVLRPYANLKRIPGIP